MSTTYKKYDDTIKEIIIQTGNPNALPELNIPRTTALYWIQKSKKKIKLCKKDTAHNLYKNVKKLKKDIITEKTKNYFQILVCKVYKDVKDGTKRDKAIVKLIIKFKTQLPIKVLCKLASFDLKKFYSISNTKPKTIFYRTKKNQLTIREQKMIAKLARCSSLSHLSLKRLHLHAYRNSIVICGYDTFRKYISKFMINRKRNRRNKKSYNNTLITTNANHVWHIDITEFKLTNNKKVYLQVILDNFSRKVISWRLSLRKTLNITMKNIAHATRISSPLFLLSDGGGENIGNKLRGFLKKKGISQWIAKVNTKYSNSIIESFFNTLKTYYINKYRYYHFHELYRLIKSSIAKYNNSPAPLFHGATANEVYAKNIDLNFLKNDLRNKIIQAKIKRLNTKLNKE